MPKLEDFVVKKPALLAGEGHIRGGLVGGAVQTGLIVVIQHPALAPKMLNYRIDGSLFVYIIFQASSGRELDQNKGLPSIL